MSLAEVAAERAAEPAVVAAEKAVETQPLEDESVLSVLPLAACLALYSAVTLSISNWATEGEDGLGEDGVDEGAGEANCNERSVRSGNGSHDDRVESVEFLGLTPLSAKCETQEYKKSETSVLAV